MHRTQRVSFCIQLGASLTFSRFSGGRRAIVGGIRRATSVFRPVPRVLYSSHPVHIKKRPPSIGSSRSIRRVRSFTNKSVRMARRAAATLRRRARSGKSYATRGQADSAGRQRSCWGRCWCSLLLHVNLLLMIYVGAALSTAARLRWDPSTYVLARELIPAEYVLAQLGLLAGAAALLALAQLAALALHARYRCRRTLLIIYALVMLLMLTAEVVAARLVLGEVEQQLAAGRAQLQAFLDVVKYTIDAIPKLELPGVEIIEQIPGVIGQLPDLVGGLPTLPDLSGVLTQLPTLPTVFGREGQLSTTPGVGSHYNATELKPRRKRNILLNMNVIKKLQSIVEDLMRDAPMNIKVAMISMYVLAALQASAVVLALFAAIAEPSRRPPAVVAASPRCLSECPVYDA